ncbi:MAG: pyridoxal-dependent decarboxylase [Longimicrobiales bacterium]|nr:pyridoxal-dependent decarboxylase [Longimicrobiales bacterium]
MRRYAHEVADWIADYLASVGDLPVFPEIAPGDLGRQLGPLSEEGEPFSEILAEFDRVILPATTHWNHPRFHAWFAVSGSGPGILAEAIVAALNLNGMVWRAGPSVTELEEHVVAHLARALGLPPGWTGSINDTASISTLHALAAARHVAFPDATDRGLAGSPPGRVYASCEAHSSVDRAVMALGMGREGIVRLPRDRDHLLDVGALRSAIRSDREAGHRPVAVVATLGTTSTTSLDPVDAMARVAREAGVWLHVDAAYGGALALLPEWRNAFRGWEKADSIVFNPHKWLFTPIDCSVLWVRGRDRLRAAFAVDAEYLRTAESGRATDLMEYGIALGRRFRALKLWFVLRYFGLEGIRRRLRHHIELARSLAGTIEETEGWSVRVHGEMGLIVFRATAGGKDGAGVEGALNRAIVDRVARSGVALLSHTELDGTVWIRLAVGNLRTTAEDLEITWSAVCAAREACLVELPGVNW